MKGKIPLFWNAEVKLKSGAYLEWRKMELVSKDKYFKLLYSRRRSIKPRPCCLMHDQAAYEEIISVHASPSFSRPSYAPITSHTCTYSRMTPIFKTWCLLWFKRQFSLLGTLCSSTLGVSFGMKVCILGQKSSVSYNFPWRPHRAEKTLQRKCHIPGMS